MITIIGYITIAYLSYKVTRWVYPVARGFVTGFMDARSQGDRNHTSRSIVKR